MIIKGKSPNEDIAKLAGASAPRGAKPLNFNQFKIPLMTGLVTRAVRGVFLCDIHKLLILNNFYDFGVS